MCHPVGLVSDSAVPANPYLAIDFARRVLSKDEPHLIAEFLEDWKNGAWSLWPDYVDFCARITIEGVKNAA